MSQNELSIWRLESTQTATGALAGGEDDATAFRPISQNERSIQMIESLNAADGRLAGGEEVPQARGPVTNF